MTLSFDVLWLNASPSLKHFDQPLLRSLSQHHTVAQWAYRQSLDEASSLDHAVSLLHDYLQCQPRPVHLAGHGISGVVGLIYARRFPEQVRSLTLLAVGAQPAITWQAHYYVQRQLITCSRQQLLACTTKSLLGQQFSYPTKALVTSLARDLEEAPSPHSLFSLATLPKGGVTMPLLVCGSKTDPVVHPPVLQEWLAYFKSDDTLWQCPDGRHFFHSFQPQLVGEQMIRFWRCLEAQQSSTHRFPLKINHH
ncbi:MAG: alpha/beta hydrolase [Tildeniella nuda ZEHNDER 1965/U140]|jgi:pimeloyl-ACP methyl ester carboxylesterase|nr:alpha/beta hydrolase [Tildeniella nuda ZEHNDER 1965/U140]